MERRQERPEGRFGEAAAAMEATAAVWSLLHRLAQGCVGYLGLARLSGDYSPPATTPQQQVGTVSSDYGVQEEEEEDIRVVVQVESRSMAFQRNRKLNQGVRDGGNNY
uniref:Uncharacterized protein n=1 Tax=Avena sativa TaxID=4498 RepID=A0ACD5ZXR1_AVESA